VRQSEQYFIGAMATAPKKN